MGGRLIASSLTLDFFGTFSYNINIIQGDGWYEYRQRFNG
jgi:hypothetical protein